MLLRSRSFVRDDGPTPRTRLMEGSSSNHDHDSLGTSQPGGWTKLGGVRFRAPGAWSMMRKGNCTTRLVLHPHLGSVAVRRILWPYFHFYGRVQEAGSTLDYVEGHLSTYLLLSRDQPTLYLFRLRLHQRPRKRNLVHPVSR